MARTVERYPDAAALANAAAEQLIALGHQAIQTHNNFAVALSGGSTPKRLFQLLATGAGETGPYRNAIDWQHVHVFWGDERTVPPDHPESNYGMAAEFLLSQVPIPPSNIYRMAGEKEAQVAAAEYEQSMRNFFATHRSLDDGIPQFDLIHLGLGDDGHTLSLFPDSDAVHQEVAGTMDRWVVPNYVAKFETWRITMTTRIVNQAAQVSFLVGGANKATILQQVLEGAYQPITLPSQLIEPTAGQLTWMVDAEAAAALSSS